MPRPANLAWMWRGETGEWTAELSGVHCSIIECGGIGVSGEYIASADVPWVAAVTGASFNGPDEAAADAWALSLLVRLYGLYLRARLWAHRRTHAGKRMRQRAGHHDGAGGLR